MIDVFNITLEELENSANALGESRLGLSAVVAELKTRTICQQSELVRSILPEPYRRALRHIDGEKVVEEAEAGQTTFELFAGETAKMALADDWDEEAVMFSNLALYVDFGGMSKAQQSVQSVNLGLVSINRSRAFESYGTDAPLPYRARTRADRLSESAYTLNENAGLVTLRTALSQGQTVCADYDHAMATKCDFLRMLVINLTLFKLESDMPWASDAGRQQIQRDYEAALALMDRISSGQCGIDTFDLLKLVDETRTTSDDQRLNRWRWI